LAGLERLKERMSGDDMMLHAPKCDRSSVALTLPSLDVGGSGDTYYHFELKVDDEDVILKPHRIKQ